MVQWIAHIRWIITCSASFDLKICYQNSSIVVLDINTNIKPSEWKVSHWFFQEATQFRDFSIDINEILLSCELFDCEIALQHRKFKPHFLLHSVYKIWNWNLFQQNCKSISMDSAKRKENKRKERRMSQFNLKPNPIKR